MTSTTIALIATIVALLVVLVCLVVALVRTNRETDALALRHLEVLAEKAKASEDLLDQFGESLRLELLLVRADETILDNEVAMLNLDVTIEDLRHQRDYYKDMLALLWQRSTVLFDTLPQQIVADLKAARAAQRRAPQDHKVKR